MKQSEISPECQDLIDDLLKGDSGIDRKNVLLHFQSLIGVKTLSLIGILQKYEITFQEANDACKGEFIRRLFGIFSQERLAPILQEISEYKEDILEYLGKCGTSNFVFTIGDILHLTRNEIIDVACRTALNKQYLTLGLLFSKYKITKKEVMDTGFLINAVAKDSITTIKWLQERLELDRKDITYGNSVLIRTAAQNGQLDILQWIHENYTLTIENVIVSNNWSLVLAAENGHTHILEWLKDTFNLTKSDISENALGMAMEGAVKGHHHDAIRWLRENYGVTHYSEIILLLSEIYIDTRDTVFRAYCKLHPELKNWEIRELILCACAKEKWYTNEIPTQMLDLIAKAFELQGKSRDDVIYVLNDIYFSDAIIIPLAITYLVDQGIIPIEKSKPTITLEAAKEALPGYIIAKPEEILERLAKLH